MQDFEISREQFVKDQREDEDYARFHDSADKFLEKVRLEYGRNNLEWQMDNGYLRKVDGLLYLKTKMHKEWFERLCIPT